MQSWVRAIWDRSTFQADKCSIRIAGFAGIVTAAAAWSIWGGEIFPAEKDPTGGTMFQVRGLLLLGTY